MRFENIENLQNFYNKNKIKIIILTKEILFNQDFIDILSTYPNLNLLSIKTSNGFDSSLNYLIDELCISNITNIEIHFKYISFGIWFTKNVKAYYYNKSLITRNWNTLSVYDSDNHYNYNNIPNNINLLKISCNKELLLLNLPTNLLKIEINSQFVNSIWKMDHWKIPFDCEICYNGKVINKNY